MDWLRLSATLIEKLYVPGTVGVPLIWPVLVLRVNIEGRLPVMLQV
jgi:hypothetical protein